MKYIIRPESRTNDSAFESLKKMCFVLDVGYKIIDQLRKENQKAFAELEKPYDGWLRPFMEEYYDTFIRSENEDIKKDMEKELTEEWMYIECFCRWLDKEKGTKKCLRKKK